MGTYVLSLPMRPPSLPLWSILVAAASIAAETLVVAGDEHRVA